MAGDLSIRPLSDSDADRVRQFIVVRWAAETVVAHGVVYYPHTLPGFAAFEDDELVGLLTYCIENDECEIVTIDSLRPSSGVGTALIGEHGIPLRDEIELEEKL